MGITAAPPGGRGLARWEHMFTGQAQVLACKNTGQTAPHHSACMRLSPFNRYLVFQLRIKRLFQTFCEL